MLLNPWLKHTIEAFPELLEPIAVEKKFFVFFVVGHPGIKRYSKFETYSTARQRWNSCQPVLGQSSESMIYLSPIWYLFFQQGSRNNFSKIGNNNNMSHSTKKKDLQNQAASSPPIFWSFLPSIFEMASATSAALSQSCSGSSMGGRALGTVSTSTSFPTAR